MTLKEFRAQTLAIFVQYIVALQKLLADDIVDNKIEPEIKQALVASAHTLTVFVLDEYT